MISSKRFLTKSCYLEKNLFYSKTENTRIYLSKIYKKIIKVRKEKYFVWRIFMLEDWIIVSIKINSSVTHVNASSHKNSNLVLKIINYTFISSRWLNFITNDIIPGNFFCSKTFHQNFCFSKFLAIIFFFRLSKISVLRELPWVAITLYLRYKLHILWI